MFRLSAPCLALALATAIGCGASLPAFADPPPWAGVWKHHGKHDRHHHDDDDDYRVVYVPRTRIVEQRVYSEYAPAYPIPVARGLPYGFNRGTCDRSMISSELVGNVVGGVAGGLAGTRIGQGSGRTAATIGGTILGVVVGGQVGRAMDPVDQGCMAGALSYVPDQRQVAWAGDEGERYRVTPVRSYQQAGRYCREYTATAVIGGRRQQTYGTACMQPDGQWQVVE